MASSERHYKVLSLLRVSTKEQDMQRQQSDIEFHVQRFANPEDGSTPIIVEVVDTIALQGISGAGVERTPEFKSMLHKLDTDPSIGGILISQLDRFLRPEDPTAYSALAVFQERNKLIFCDAARPLNYNVPEDRAVIMTQLEAAFNERRKIKFRTNGKKEQLITDPTVSVVKLPNGVEHFRDEKKYGAKTKKGYFKYTPYASNTVKPAFEKVAAGQSIQSVAKELGFSSVSALRNVLENKWWLGISERIWQRKVTKDRETGRTKVGERKAHPRPIVHHTNLFGDEALISHELFETVQTIIGVHKTTWSKHNTNAEKFLVNGMVWCGKCGSRMYLKWDKRSGKPATYLCSSYKNESGACGVSRLKAEATDKEVWKAAFRNLTDLDMLRHSVAEGLKSEDSVQRHAELEAAERMLEAAQKDLRKASKLYMLFDGDEASDEAREAFATVNRAKRDLSEAKMRVATAKTQAEPFGSSDPVRIAAGIMARFIGLSRNGTLAEKRSAMVDVIEKVTISESGKAILKIRGGLPILDMDEEPVHLTAHQIGLNLMAFAPTDGDANLSKSSRS